MYSAEHRFTNLLNDRLMIPHVVWGGGLYVDHNGAYIPTGALPIKLSTGLVGKEIVASSR